MTFTEKVTATEERFLRREARALYKRLRSWKLVAMEMGRSIGYIWKIANRKK